MPIVQAASVATVALDFDRTLATRGDPSFLGALGHHVVPDAPAGAVSGLAVPTQRTFAAPPVLPEARLSYRTAPDAETSSPAPPSAVVAPAPTSRPLVRAAAPDLPRFPVAVDRSAASTSPVQRGGDGGAAADPPAVTSPTAPTGRSDAPPVSGAMVPDDTRAGGPAEATVPTVAQRAPLDAPVTTGTAASSAADALPDVPAPGAHHRGAAPRPRIGAPVDPTRATPPSAPPSADAAVTTAPSAPSAPSAPRSAGAAGSTGPSVQRSAGAAGTTGPKVKRSAGAAGTTGPKVQRSAGAAGVGGTAVGAATNAAPAVPPPDAPAVPPPDAPAEVRPIVGHDPFTTATDPIEPTPSAGGEPTGASASTGPPTGAPPTVSRLALDDGDGGRREVTTDHPWTGPVRVDEHPGATGASPDRAAVPTLGAGGVIGAAAASPVSPVSPATRAGLAPTPTHRVAPPTVSRSLSVTAAPAPADPHVASPAAPRFVARPPGTTAVETHRGRRDVPAPPPTPDAPVLGHRPGLVTTAALHVAGADRPLEATTPPVVPSASMVQRVGVEHRTNGASTGHAATQRGPALTTPGLTRQAVSTPSFPAAGFTGPAGHGDRDPVEPGAAGAVEIGGGSWEYVQRQVEATAPAEPAPPAEPAGAAGDTLTRSASAGDGSAASAAAGGPPGDAEIHELLRALYPPLRRRLGHDLLVDRERSGYRTDIRF